MVKKNDTFERIIECLRLWEKESNEALSPVFLDSTQIHSQCVLRNTQKRFFSKLKKKEQEEAPDPIRPEPNICHPRPGAPLILSAEHSIL